MKPSAFKPQYGTRDYLRLLGVIFRNSYELETAFYAQKWAYLVSTAVYNLVFILFINVIYTNTQTIAGYSHDQVLFFLFMQNFSFFASFSWSMTNLHSLITSVNKGDLDLILSKPLPHLFYITLRKITILETFSNLIPNIYIASLIAWSNLALEPRHVMIGIGVFLCGQLALHVTQFLFTLPVFFSGKAEEFFHINYELLEPKIPWEGLSQSTKTFFMAVVPVFITTSVTVSVMLGKSSAPYMLALCGAVALIALIIKRLAWNFALRHYTSASS